MAAKRPKTPQQPAALGAEALALHARLLGEYSFDDGASLAMLGELCATLDRLRQVQQVIQTEGLTVVGSQGQRRAHPLLQTEDALRRSFLGHCRALRLTAEV